MFCKNCHHMFQRGILQHVWLQGLWPRYCTCWASLGSVALATPGAWYFTFTSTWHRAHIARGSLLSVSSPHPSTPLCSSPSIADPSVPLYTFSPETSSLCHVIHHRTIEKPQISNLFTNVSHVQAPTLHQVNCTIVLTVKGEKTIL